jgi:hypothetical protein
MTFQIIFILLVLISIIYIFNTNKFLENNILKSLENNLESSRVWETIIKSEDVSQDSSLQARIELFECHFSSFASSPMTFLFGRSWEESGCVSYIHSGLSIAFDYGLLGFFSVSFIIYICLSSTIKFILSVSSLKPLAIFLIIFASISLLGRA